MPTVKETAKRLNVHERTVYNWLNSGRLEGHKNKNNEWVISFESINKILDQRNYEGNLVHAEYLYKKELDKQEEESLKKIGQFCTKFNETNSIEWAKKIKNEVDKIDRLQETKKIINNIVADKMKPMEKL